MTNDFSTQTLSADGQRQMLDEMTAAGRDSWPMLRFGLLALPVLMVATQAFAIAFPAAAPLIYACGAMAAAVPAGRTAGELAGLSRFPMTPESFGKKGFLAKLRTRTSRLEKLSARAKETGKWCLAAVMPAFLLAALPALAPLSVVLLGTCLAAGVVSESVRQFAEGSLHNAKRMETKAIGIFEAEAQAAAQAAAPNTGASSTVAAPASPGFNNAVAGPAGADLPAQPPAPADKPQQPAPKAPAEKP